MDEILLFGCVCEHVCDFPMYCTVIFFLFFLFTVCEPVVGSTLGQKSQDISSASAGGGLALNISFILLPDSLQVQGIS